MDKLDLILQKLDVMDSKVSETQKDMAGLREEVGVIRRDVGMLQKDVGILQEEMKETKEELRNTKENLGRELHIVKFRIENEFIHGVHIVAEGHFDLHRKLDMALENDKKRELLQLHVIHLEHELEVLKSLQAATA